MVTTTSETMDDEGLAAKAKDYYDSEDAFHFYRTIWGRETIHIGIYEDATSDVDEIHRAEQRLHDKLIAFSDLAPDAPRHAVDLGAGFGGTVFYLTSRFPRLTAVSLDIASKCCEQARDNAEARGVSDRVEVVEASYLESGLPDNCADLCLSVDAFLHIGPGYHKQCLQEAFRLLKPGGRLVFTDILQSEHAVDMEPIYQRIHLSKLGTIESFLWFAQQVGFVDVSFHDHSVQVARHYGSVRNVLLNTAADFNPAFVERMSEGLGHWVKAASSGNLRWGVFVMHKPLLAGAPRS